MQNFRAMGLRPQTTVPPAAGGFAPKPPVSGSWGLHPQTPKTAPALRISGYAPVHNVTFLFYMTEIFLFALITIENFLRGATERNTR